MQIVVPTFALETVGCNVATQTEKKNCQSNRENAIRGARWNLNT